MKKKYVWINEQGVPEGSPQTRMVEPPPEGWVEWQEVELDENPLLQYQPQYFEEENIARLVPVFDLEAAKVEKWWLIKGERDSREFGNFSWGGYTFDCNIVSQRRLQGAIQLAMINPDMTVEWTLADNSVQTLTAADCIEIGQALASHVNECHERGRILRQQINEATTLEDLEAIVW